MCIEDSQSDGRDTLAIHGGRRPDSATGAVVAPIHQTTTYAQPAVGQDAGYTYSRAHNPTVTALEEALAALEDAPFCTAYATGMAAISALCFAELSAGDHVICSDAVYGGTVRLLERVLRRFGVSASFVTATESDAYAAALRPETRLILVETPANPTLRLVDIAAVAEIARGAGVLLAVDNTFLTAALQRPFEFGADVVIYSTTKFIEGHNTTVGGALLCRDAARHERLLEVRKTLGAIQAPFDAWLTLKGIKTLPLRLRQHSANALVVARWLEADPRIARVSHPGLESFPQRALARRQQDAGGGLIAFELVGGAAAGVALMGRLELCTLAENLGATETLVTHPASMTHGDVPREHRERVGITEGLVRLSVGLEDPQAVIADLDQALTAVAEELRVTEGQEVVA